LAACCASYSIEKTAHMGGQAGQVVADHRHDPMEPESERKRNH
jgi:hypothetical protein